MLKRLHAVAGVLALLTVLSFWVSTVVAELFLGGLAVAAVKAAIVTGVFFLVPAMAVAGMTGAALSRGQSGRRVARKAARMKILAANGVLVMIPAALFLNSKAAAGEIDTLFVLIQAAELLVGLVQMTVMAFNLRDGLRMAGRLAEGSPPG